MITVGNFSNAYPPVKQNKKMDRLLGVVHILDHATYGKQVHASLAKGPH